MRFWGWTATHMVNALWVYSMTVVLIRDAYTTLSPGSVLFTPFALMAVWASYYLWVHRDLFQLGKVAPDTRMRNGIEERPENKPGEAG